MELTYCNRPQVRAGISLNKHPIHLLMPVFQHGIITGKYCTTATAEKQQLPRKNDNTIHILQNTCNHDNVIKWKLFHVTGHLCGESTTS